MSTLKTSKIHKYLTFAIVLLISTALIVGLIFGIAVGNLFGSNAEQVVYTNEYYQLKGNPTEYQKDTFKALTNELEKDPQDEFAIASLVVQSFVSDYFTWSNKLGTYDVGGKSFVFAIEFTNFMATSRRYLYTPIQNYLASGLELSDLQEVEDVTILNVNYAYDYSYYGQNYLTYYIEASWTYKPNENVDTSIFQNVGYFTLIKTEEGRYEIARFY